MCVRSLSLEHEVAQLRAALATEKESSTRTQSLVTGERERAESSLRSLQEEVARLRDRYERLVDSHRKLLRVNQSLEEKLLSVVRLLPYAF